jgi:quinolinate synthase
MKASPKVHEGVSCPHEYLNRSDRDVLEAIRAIRERLGDQLTILGHHYQGDAVVGLSDYVGDSFKLCRDAAACNARYIVFCGVRFMAESARILARPNQTVIHPEETAGCPMADMAETAQVKEAWNTLTRLNPGRRIVPVAYMNSSAEIKAFCGRYGGSICTSSNARRVLEWAWSEGDLVLFMPDEHLGRNTAHEMGVPPQEVLIWNPQYAEAHGRDERYSRARMVVWKGFCYVHTRFRAEQVEQLRKQHPGIRVIVHPECPREVVEAADASGSTEAIIRMVRESKVGDVLGIGTEINLVARLAKQCPDRTILPLSPSLCLNMAKITINHVLWVLDNLGAVCVVRVEPSVVEHARAALQKMLDIGS